MSECDQPGGVHPHNPAAIRGPKGIWNELLLPILLWEIPAQRKVIPVSVQSVVSHPSPVLRVSIDIDTKVRFKHADVLEFYEDFDLESWEYVREVPELTGRRWEFIRIVESRDPEPWPLMTVIGEDEKGSLNLISMHRRNRRWLRKLTEGRLGYQRRVK